MKDESGKTTYPGQLFSSRSDEFLARWADQSINHGEPSLPQGVALGWVNCWPFGPRSIVFQNRTRRYAIPE
jgi:hypothetical protein